jgi:MPBQ/MSBQ methyltransferase
MPPVLPPYFDALIAARRAGQAGRHVHLGYWDDPPPPHVPPASGEFEAAQARLTERVIGLVPLHAGQSVLDVACGFGGTLAAIDARLEGMALTGLNIDVRQLDLCRGAVKRPGNSLALVTADACALPFPDATFDHLFCVEAMFHFPSRQTFMAEAARVLRPGGMLVVTDILLRRPVPGAPGADAIAATIRRDYGPWPEPWIGAETIHGIAHRTGLLTVRNEDWSGATLPSYRTIAPVRPGKPLSAGDVFRWLHGNGWLGYRMFSFRRQ